MEIFGMWKDDWSLFQNNAIYLWYTVEIFLTDVNIFGYFYHMIEDQNSQASKKTWGFIKKNALLLITGF
jgi:hypothetical protein